MIFRVGIGYDVHKIDLLNKESKPLVLGGIKISDEIRLIAHSDGDVLIHAICDAILGAANLGDIGLIYPNTNENYKNYKSTIFLRKINKVLIKKGFTIVNIDSTIILENPKLSFFYNKIKKNLSKILTIEPKKISIKATTNEGIGFIGRGEGIAAIAVVLLEKNN